ncbi:MAG: hypothetical protein II897_07525 [Clostridia bacterium]|nr:hypothetical protein [Clostridia bacterium]
MKSLYRSAVTLILLCSMVLSLFAGCKPKDPAPAEACFEEFMGAIAAFDYEKAFSLVSRASSSMPTPTPEAKQEEHRRNETPYPTIVPTPTPYPTNFMVHSDFVAKYSDIFSAIRVSEVKYEKLSAEWDGDDRIIRYSADYVSELAGDLVNEYEIRIVNEDGAAKVAWEPSLIFPGMSWGDSVRISTVAARRGDIIASGELLAQTVTLNAVIGDVDDIPDLDDFTAAVSEILGMEPDAVKEKFDNAKSRNVLLAQLNDNELTPDIHEALDRLEGARIILNYGVDRIYPQGELLAHTIGYIGYAEEGELEALNEGRTETDGLYSIHSLVGRSGIEKAYEKTLRGKDGLNITIRNSEGALVSTVYRKPVEHGADLELTIDMDLQRRAKQVMDLVLWGEDNAGAVVVMNPVTGELKALLSYPEYDLNKMAIHAEPGYYESLKEAPNNPLQNRNTLGLYPPGSSMKVFTASAALDLGYVTPDHVFTGNIVKDYWTPTNYGRWVWPPIKRTEIKNRQEPLNMANGLLHSDNIYFADLALMMGEEPFFTYLRGIGFEQSFPFELSVARSTLKVRYDTENYWNTRSIAETGYGQGQVTISPIQLAAMYSAFRNGGTMMTPRLAKSLYRTEGTEYAPVETFESKVWKQNAIQQSTVDTLDPMLRAIMDRTGLGTGRFLRARNVTVAGKTGTAEIGSSKKREVSWFIGYRVDVAEEDELLVLVMLEIPTTDPFRNLKFDIARELISMDPTEELIPDVTPSPSPDPHESDIPSEATPAPGAEN